MTLFLCRLAVAVVLAVCWAGPVSAQELEADTRFSVEGLSSTIQSGDRYDARVRVHNAGPGQAQALALRLTSYHPTISRFRLQQALDEGILGPASQTFTVDIPSVPAQSSRLIALQEVDGGLDFRSVAPGVVPIRLELLDGEEVVDTVRTAVVVAPPGDVTPLRAATVLRLDPSQSLTHAEPSVLDAALRPRGALGRVVRELAGLGPFGLAIDPLLLERAGTSAVGPSFLANVDALLDGGQIEPVPIADADADIVALVRAGLTDRAGEHVAASRARLPGGEWLMPHDGVDVPTMRDVVVPAGFPGVILDERFLLVPADRALRTSPAPVQQLGGVDGGAALIADPWLPRVAVQAGEDVPVAAQRILAELAAVFFERPNDPSPRGILLVLPPDLSPPAGLLTWLARGLSKAEWANAVTPSGLAEDVEAEAAILQYPPEAREAELPQAYAQDLRRALDNVRSLDSILVDPAGQTAALDQRLRLAASAHYREPSAQAEGRALIDSVREEVVALSRAVEVVEGPSLTLTSVEGQIPVTLRNNADTAMRVAVRLETTRYEFEDPVHTLQLEAGQTTTVMFAARASAPGGMYPVQVAVTDPAGEILLAGGSVLVRSTASWMALAVTVGAGTFLVLWWMRDLLRRRARPQPAADADAGGAGDADADAASARSGGIQA